MHAVPGMPSLKSLRLFDTCMTLGMGVLSTVPEWVTVDDVLQTMDRYEIEEALVHDHHARAMCPREHGNRRLMEAIRGKPRLHPVWVIQPPKKAGRGPAKELVEEMLNDGQPLRAVSDPVEFEIQPALGP